jgi:hypothetical protein
MPFDNDSLIYRKKKGDKRYQLVGPEFSGFPSDGLWLITTERYSRGSRHIAFLGEAPAPLKLAGLERYHDRIATSLNQYLRDQATASHTFPSTSDIVNFVLKQLAQLSHEEDLEAKKDQKHDW